MLPEYSILDSRMDFLTLEERQELQGERLRAQFKHCYDNAPFWRKKFEEAGITPGDIKSLADIKKMPFCTREELQKDQEENPPYGSYLAVHPSKLIQFFATSGTTGRPLIRVLSKRDWNYINARYQRYTPLNPGDVMMIPGPTDGMAGPSFTIGMRASWDPLVVKAARFSTQDKVRLIHQLKPTLISSTPSFLLYLAEVADKMNMNFVQMGGIKILESVGEPGGSIEATRKRLIKAWAPKVLLDRYGATEIFFLGRTCEKNVEMHVADDFLMVEVVEIGGDRVLGAGERGELVYTNLIGETQPLLRYRSRDVGRLAEFGPCPGCGATCTRIVKGVEGRVDDMIWYKGINIFPSAIESAVRSFGELTNEYEIVLDQKGSVEILTVRVEVIPDVPAERYEQLGEEIEVKLLGALEGVHSKVELLQEGSLPKTQAKAKRVKDNRPV